MRGRSYEEKVYGRTNHEKHELNTGPKIGD
jgi:hypothetical protein